MVPAGIPLQAVLFDLYDTLAWIDTERLRQSRAELARRAGLSLEALTAHWRHTGEDRRLGRLGPLEAEMAHLLAASGAPGAEARAHDLAAFELQSWRASVAPYPDSRPTLRALRASGTRVGIVSNCTSQAGAMAEALGLAAEVDDVVLSCSVGLQKPDPAIYRLALERLGAIEPAAALLVDDLPENLDSARALGLRTALIVRPGQERPATPCHPRVANLADLEALLRGAGVPSGEPTAPPATTLTPEP